MKIDYAKRRRVMERSQALGHCICNPRQPCPCALFLEQDVCPCAGERLEPTPAAHARLMDQVRHAGCASKIAPADLEAVLGRLPPVTDPAVISGLAAGDDAAIYRLADNLCLVQTVDVFTPCVDDPRLFGRICAANCLSDIYAMGGSPRTALSILAFPSETLPTDLMHQMLAGAMETFGQAGVALIGGHSVKDEEIKLGFAITGLIDPALAAALDQPRPGDVLVLTKPLGTGVLTFARQIGQPCAPGLAAAETAMATLNQAAARAMIKAGASACTDVTGFGLFGHLFRLVRAHGLAAEVWAEALLAFEGVREALQRQIVPGAIERNREYVGADLEVAPGVEETSIHLGLDAQTSGGLLIAIPPDRLPQLQRALAEEKVPGFVIGKITSPSQEGGPRSVAALKLVAGGMPDAFADQIQVMPATAITAAADEGLILNSIPPNMNTTPISVPNSTPTACCAGPAHPEARHGTAAESQQAFGAFLRSVMAAGALEEKTKELILFSLVVQSRCHPCFDAHYQKARQMGLSQAELDEAAWCAIALGGAPVRLFYQECLQRQNIAGGQS